MLKTVSSTVNAIGALNFKGTWNATTNTPTIVSGVGVKGDYFVVGVAGSTTIDGISNWGIGDWIVYNGNVWQRVEGGADLNGVNLSVSGTTTLSGQTASTALALNASKEVVSVTNTGTGDNVLATSPTLVTPALGTPASGVVTNLTGTASININGTVGATTANTGAFTTLNTSGAVVFNDAGADVNFRVEGDTDANLLFVDASTDRIGIGTNTPLTKLGIKGSGSFGSAYDVDEFQIFDPSGVNTAKYGFYINQSYPASTVSAIFTLGVQNSNNHVYSLAFATAGTERMRIASNGIVTMSAYGAGAATFSAAGVISSVSDETWKIKDGVPVDPDAMLEMLEPGYWYYNEEKAPTFGADRQLGFYAQNVNAAIGPEAAPTPEEGKPWGYYDRSVLAITVMSLKNALNSIQELKAKNDALEARLAALEAQ
jgi:hypothetical protein